LPNAGTTSAANSGRAPSSSHAFAAAGSDQRMTSLSSESSNRSGKRRSGVSFHATPSAIPSSRNGRKIAGGAPGSAPVRSRASSTEMPFTMTT
jgi:hypothetical protein